jgi:hypothetical protein
MRLPQRPDDLRHALFGNDDLDAILRDALLDPHPADGRIGALACEERSCSERGPGAPLVVADPPGPGREDGVARRLERLLGDEIR